jgi:hypothetical protein
MHAAQELDIGTRTLTFNAAALATLAPNSIIAWALTVDIRLVSA